MVHVYFIPATDNSDVLIIFNIYQLIYINRLKNNFETRKRHYQIGNKPRNKLNIVHNYFITVLARGFKGWAFMAREIMATAMRKTTDKI